MDERSGRCRMASKFRVVPVTLVTVPFLISNFWVSNLKPQLLHLYERWAQ